MDESADGINHPWISVPRFFSALCYGWRIALTLLVASYLGYALYLDVEDNVALLCYVSIFILICISWIVNNHIQWNKKTWGFIKDASSNNSVKVGVKVLVSVAIAGYIAVDVAVDQPQQLVSLAGLALLVLLGFGFSKHPSRVSWHCVWSGIVLQFIMGILVLRWHSASNAAKWFGDQITRFLEYAKFGSQFVYGEKYTQHAFAMDVMSMLFFFSAVISMLQYLGVLQYIVSPVGRVVGFMMSTSATESFIAAGNMFLGPSDSVVMVKSMVPTLTLSEMHSLMASGMATIGGGTMAVYISFGVPASHLVSASLMSAPAALAVAKLLYPETRQVKTQLTLTRLEAPNMLSAFSQGAVGMIPVVASVVVCIIGFLAAMQFLDSTVEWFGARAGVHDLNVQIILSWLLFPVTYLMGIEWSDCGQVAELLGVKTFLNEMVAYSQLSELISNRQQGLQPAISVRSEAIATYALCGYANVGTIGTMIGLIASLDPNKAGDVSKVAVRSLVAATLASLMTGCVAGLLYKE